MSDVIFKLYIFCRAGHNKFVLDSRQRIEHQVQQRKMLLSRCFNVVGNRQQGNRQQGNRQQGNRQQGKTLFGLKTLSLCLGSVVVCLPSSDICIGYVRCKI